MRSLKPHLNQVRSWVEMGATDHLDRAPARLHARLDRGLPAEERPAPHRRGAAARTRRAEAAATSRAPIRAPADAARALEAPKPRSRRGSKAERPARRRGHRGRRGPRAPTRRRPTAPEVAAEATAGHRAGAADGDGERPKRRRGRRGGRGRARAAPTRRWSSRACSTTARRATACGSTAPCATRPCTAALERASAEVVVQRDAGRDRHPPRGLARQRRRLTHALGGRARRSSRERGAGPSPAPRATSGSSGLPMNACAPPAFAFSRPPSALPENMMTGSESSAVLLAHAPQHLPAVEAGHHHVEHDEVGRVAALQGAQALLGGRGLLHHHAVVLEVDADQPRAGADRRRRSAPSRRCAAADPLRCATRNPSRSSLLEPPMPAGV